MPCNVSVSAADFRRLGANQREPYQARIRSRTCPSLILMGSRLCGVIASRCAVCSMIEGEPQNSQRCATRPSVKTEMAWQLWHCTSRLASPQSRPVGGWARACCSSISAIASGSPCCAGDHGTMVPQYGQASACLAAFHTRSPPHSGQGCLPTVAFCAGGGGGVPALGDVLT